ncbi:MAG: bifunctional (p)ppGpp synthetase/guanosine-3',5'-bis(diphosphate) 3'-pyrophosphohydrolase [Nitrococcus mobilis]|nr:bifunctional (p)ppGpp synthetase/guanosine-3',5'-bis(diphosphate) 3'-pyrophosphohydrolase [Nitrococcus mobilis]
MVDVSDEFENLPDLDIPFEDWVRRLSCELSQTELARLRLAWEQAQSVYSGQHRASGEGCFRHALSVATILAGMRLDADAVIAGLLHALPSLGVFEPAHLAAEFGEVVPSLIDGVAQVVTVSEQREPPGKQSTGQVEALRKMILAMARDIRVVFIALAQRLVDIRTLERRPVTVQQRMARQTLELYAPLANRLGLLRLKWELEDRSLRILKPADYRCIARLLAERRVDRERDIRALQRQASAALQQAGIDAQVTGRAKHIYSIWRKMQQKGLDFHHLLDIRAIRVLVRTIPDCYAALGVIQSLWQPIPDGYDDYIATPKANNYQSLHAAVIGPTGKSLEVQIRTREMHQRAELGVAAHWRYKEGGRRDAAFDDKVAWLRQLLQWGQEEASEYAPIDRYKAELFEHRIYVLTPRGDVLDLPRGATPLDFAYHVHTQIGHRCRGAKVNAKMVPLTHTLQSGDQVEVLTARHAEPSRDWLNPNLGYLKSAQARSRVRRWFRLRDFDRNVTDGRALLERELRRLGGMPSVSLERLAQRARFAKPDEFLAAIGRGDITGGYIAGLINEPGSLEEPKPWPVPAHRRGKSSRVGSDAIVIDGVGNLLTRLAQCCRPVAGDCIIGYITRNQGISVHRRDCPNVARLRKTASARLIEAVWGLSGEQRYPVDVEIQTDDPQGLLKAISTVLGSEQVKLLEAVSCSEQQTRRMYMNLTLEVRDTEQMNRVMHRIAAMRHAHGVRRVTRT